MQQKSIFPTFGKTAAAVAAVISFSSWATNYNEAPQLTELVKSGQLPAEERLPEEPLNADTEVPDSYGIASPGPMRTSQLWKETK